MEVVQVVTSDLKGILAVDALALSRRSYREFVKRLPRQTVVTNSASRCAPTSLKCGEGRHR